MLEKKRERLGVVQYTVLCASLVTDRMAASCAVATGAYAGAYDSGCHLGKAVTVYTTDMDAKMLRDCVLSVGLRAPEEVDTLSKAEMVQLLNKLHADLTELADILGEIQQQQHPSDPQGQHQQYSDYYSFPTSVNISSLDLPFSKNRVV